MKFKSYLLSSTSKDSITMLSGSAISTLLGLLMVWLLTKNLTQYEFGLFVSGLTFVQLFTDLFEMGINQATLNFLSGQKLISQKELVINTLFLKLLVAFVIGVFVYFESRYLSEVIFSNRRMIPYIALGSIGISFSMVLLWIQTLLQSQRKFLSSTLLSLITNVLKVVLLFILFRQIATQPHQIFLIFQVLTFVPILVALIIYYQYIPTFVTNFKNRVTMREIKKIFRFGLPLGIAFAISAIYTRLDQIMVLKLTSPEDAAIYGLASRITLPLLLVVSSFSSAIVPRFVSIGDNHFSNYFKKSLLATSLICLAVLIGIIVLPYLLPLIFGNSYLPSVLSAQVLLAGMIFFILSSPFYNLIIYRYKNTTFSIVLSSLSLIVIFLLLNSLVPSLKSLGAALSVAIVYALQFGISIIYLFTRFRKNEKGNIFTAG